MLQIEFDELVKAIDDIGGSTNFNTIPLLDGNRGAGSPLKIQIGANSGQYTELNLADMQGKALGLYDGEGAIVSVSTQEEADRAIGIVDQAINRVASQRAYLGAKTRRLEHTINNLENTALNLTAAESRIRDADIALEVLNLVQAQIRMQASLAVAAQANIAQQMMLQLLWPSR